MLDRKHLSLQVKNNCNISDARYWDSYSLCGLLMRLRELYRAEKGLQLWEPVSNSDIGQWINEREKLWKEIVHDDFKKIEVQGKQFRPFDIDEINTFMRKENILYGSPGASGEVGQFIGDCVVLIIAPGSPS